MMTKGDIVSRTVQYLTCNKSYDWSVMAHDQVGTMIRCMTGDTVPTLIAVIEEFKKSIPLQKISWSTAIHHYWSLNELREPSVHPFDVLYRAGFTACDLVCLEHLSDPAVRFNCKFTDEDCWRSYATYEEVRWYHLRVRLKSFLVKIPLNSHDNLQRSKYVAINNGLIIVKHKLKMPGYFAVKANVLEYMKAWASMLIKQEQRKDPPPELVHRLIITK